MSDSFFTPRGSRYFSVFHFPPSRNCQHDLLVYCQSRNLFVSGFADIVADALSHKIGFAQRLAQAACPRRSFPCFCPKPFLSAGVSPNLWRPPRIARFRSSGSKQAVGEHSRIGGSVLCASSLLNRRDGGHRERDGGDGCDGTWVGEYHSHLHALERAADQASDGAAEPVVSGACGSCAIVGHKSGHSCLKQLCQETLQVIERGLVALPGIEPGFED